MSAGELTPWRRLRITMPFRHEGPGIVPLVDSSHAAYLGCLFRHREVLGNDPTNSIKGFKEAHEAIVNMVGEKVIPPVGTFFDKETKGPTSNVENFAGHVQDKIWAKKQLEMDAKATTQEKFVRSCTKAETCTDIFKAPITHRKYHVPSNAFKMAGRMFLSLAVSPATCGRC